MASDSTAPIRTRDSIRNRDSIRTHDSIRTRAPIRTRASIRTHDSIRNRDSIRTHDSIRTRDSIRNRDSNPSRDRSRALASEGAFAFLALMLLLFLPPLYSQSPALFDYDRSVPFQYQQELIRTDAHVEIAGAGIQTPSGKLNLLVVRPRIKGPFPAIIYQHGGGTSMLTYLAEAELLARAGALSLILDAPAVDPKRKPLSSMTAAELRDYNAAIVICERRAIDYLESLPAVDRTRIAYVGHSYGGITGGVLVGIEPRIRAFVLIGAVARYSRHVAESRADLWVEWRQRTPGDLFAESLRQLRPVDPDQYINAARHGPVLLQCGNFDFENREPCTALFAAASSPKEVRWYDTDHEFANLEATIDRIKFLEEQLRLKPIRKELDRLVTAPRKQATPSKVQ